MAAGLRITYSAGSALGLLDRAIAAGLDLRPALRSIAAEGVDQTLDRFTTKRAPNGQTWKPSSNPTGSTLVASTGLRDSISVRPPEANAVEWGSNKVYAGVHQHGAVIRPRAASALRFKIGDRWISAKKVTIPARPYLGANAENLAEFGEILVRHVGGPLGAV